MDKQLERLRKHIDTADTALLKTLAKRATISAKIGILKKVHGLYALDKNRQKQMVESRIKKGKDGGLSPTFVRKLFKLIHDESVRIQKKVV